MDADKLKELTIKRGQIKGRLTRFKTFLDSFTSDQDILQLESRFEKLQPCWDEFDVIQGEIELADDSPNQLAERDSFEKQYFDIYSQVKRSILKHSKPNELIPVNHSSSDSTTNDPTQIAVKLPTINLPTFAGQYEEWTSFFDSFLALIHKNEGLTDVQKLHYLKGALRAGAAETIKNLELTSANYEVALDLLKQQYQNKKLIVRNHIKSLFDLPRIQRDSPSTLRNLLTGVLTHLRALKALDQPTDSWDSLVVYLITTKLDYATYREWELTSSTDDLPCLKDLTDFLQRRCQVLENVSTQNVHSKDKPTFQHNKHNYVPKPISKTHFSSHTRLCALCKKPHPTYQCKDLLQASQTDRTKMLDKAKICLNCLAPGHRVQQCTSSGCRRCGKKHNTALHISDSRPGYATTSNTNHVISDILTTIEPAKQHTASSIHINSEVLLSTALVDVVSPDGIKLTCRAFLDNGSQSSFMTETVCQRLKLKKERTSFLVTGINQKSTHIHNKVNASVRSTHTNYSFNTDFFVLPKITGQLPNSKINTNNWTIPDNIKLADPTFETPGRIDLLLGQEHFLELLEVGQIKMCANMPILQNTKLGWIFGGKVTSSNTNKISCNLSTLERLDLQLQRFWKLEEPLEHKILTQDEKACERIYDETVRRGEDGRYSVTMPLKQPADDLGESKGTALKRFSHIEKRFQRQPSVHNQYKEFMEEYIDLGHMSRIAPKDINLTPEYYLPHHPVIKESSSTTKLRVVFDASSKTTNDLSLNDILLTGPTIQDDLTSIILRFRTHPIVFTADIEKMYRQIWIDPSQRPLLKLVWRDHPNDPLQHFHLNTVTYGTACAPYLATKTLQRLAVEEQATFPDASQVVLRDFYVDDLLTGCNDLETAIRLQRDLITLLKSGGFNLRKWNSNHQELLHHLPQEMREIPCKEMPSQGASKTLGLLWDTTNDTLTFNYTSPVNETKTITKRSVLSNIARLFDPLGLTSPVVIRSKIFMQELWQLKVSWDELLPQNFVNNWLDILNCFNLLNSLHIKRCVTQSHSGGSIELHGFSDASEKAYGAAVYVKHVSDCGSSSVNLLCAKSRVSPIKTVSLPRLELCGALLLAELMSDVKKALGDKAHKSTYWTDSTIVLSWLSSEAAVWKTFVANRVAKIHDLTSGELWRHVKSEDNPADLVSRGVRCTDLLQSKLWWSGPDWISSDPINWPSVIDMPPPHITDTERRKPKIIAATISSNPQNDYLAETSKKCSSFQKLLRVTAFCKRFIHNCRSPSAKHSGPLSPEELNSALITLVNLDQRKYFAAELHQLKSNGHVKNNSKLIMLKPFIDSQDIVRVGGRLQQTDLDYNNKHPIVLSDKSSLTDMILTHDHIKGLHAGPQLLLAMVRQNYWPLNGRNLARKIVHRCVTCFKAKPTSSQPQMGDLPRARTSPSRPFTNTGVDYCGPIYIKSHNKRKPAVTKGYICIFVCFATKAVHLELVSELTTEAFLAALRRFVSRRGICQNIYSDNATNFVGARKDLQELYQLLRSENHMDKLRDATSSQNITWHFIPPKSPHFGGLWEAGVKSIKYHLRRVVGNSNLTFEDYYTVLTMIEACLNSRPLTPMSSNPNDPKPLTPGHFLTGEALTALPDLHLTETPVNRLSHWQRLQQMTQHFWRRWSKEYLSELQQRRKWTVSAPDLQRGQVVLVKDDNLPPLKWTIGVVEALHPGKDGHVRVATIKTSVGQYKRAVNRLCVLPTDN